MEIINLNIKDLKPYKKNAKLHPQSQIDHLKSSIEKFGFNDPIGIWGDKNEIVEGHGRLEAAKQLGYSEIECIRLDHLSDEERRAYMLIHNQTNIETGFDFDLLNDELDNILDVDMSDFGFDIYKEENESKEVTLGKNELNPFSKVHYLITVDINLNDVILEYIEQIKQIEGVEVECTLN